MKTDLFSMALTSALEALSEIAGRSFPKTFGKASLAQGDLLHQLWPHRRWLQQHEADFAPISPLPIEPTPSIRTGRRPEKTSRSWCLHAAFLGHLGSRPWQQSLPRPSESQSQGWFGDKVCPQDGSAHDSMRMLRQSGLLPVLGSPSITKEATSKFQTSSNICKAHLR